MKGEVDGQIPEVNEIDENALFQIQTSSFEKSS